MPLTIQVFSPSGETEATLTAITGTGTAANPYTITQQGSSQFGTIEVADVANLLGLWQWKVGTRAVGRVLIVAGQTDYPILSSQQAAAAAITQAGLALEATAQSILQDTGTTLPGLISGIEVEPDVTVNPTELSSTSVDAIRSGLATSDNVTAIETSILAKIGAFTGTGVNTILGFLRAIARKDVAAPSDMGGNYDPATDSLEAIRDNSPEFGTWLITRSFITDGGSLVDVQMSLVGIAGKVARSNTVGTAALKADNGTYTLRFLVPVFFDDIPDEEITIDDADDVVEEPIVVVRKTLPPLADGLLCLCTVTAINQHGDPAVDVAVIALSKNAGADEDQIFVFNEDREYWTNSQGQTALPLLRGHRYAITVTFGDFGSRTVLRTIPDQDEFHILVKQ